MEINFDDYEQITKGEYERAKKDNYKFTMRIGFLYYKKRPERCRVILSGANDREYLIDARGMFLKEKDAEQNIVWIPPMDIPKIKYLIEKFENLYGRKY